MKTKAIIRYFLIWQVMTIFVVSSLARLFPLQRSDSYLGASISGYLKNPLLNFRSNYDGVHYALIATHGYSYGQQAFFPFYPEVIRSFRGYIDDPVLIGTLVSAVSFLAALYFLNRLILLDYSPQVAKWTIIALLVFPTSFFFSAVYTEGLFFLLLVMSFYFARTARPWVAVVCAALAGYTRLIGISLLPALFIEFMSQNRDRPLSYQIRQLIPLLVVPTGLLIYMYYLYRTTGDPFTFYSLQPAFHQQRSTQIILPYQVFWRYLKMIFTVDPRTWPYITIWLEFLTGLIFIGLSLISIFRQRLSYAVFNLFAFMLPTLTGIFTSLPRYVLVCFPAFILIGQMISDRARLRGAVLFIFSISWALFLSLFARGYWVA